MNILKPTLTFVSALTTITLLAQNVGVGTNSPGSKLSVNGNLAVGGSYATGSAPANGAAIQGAVGIGTTTPSLKLHVRDDVNGPTGIVIQNNDAGNNSIEQLIFGNEDGNLISLTAYDDGHALFPNAIRLSNTRSSGTIRLATSGGEITMLSSGNVGIGVATPSDRLSVAGDINAGTGFKVGGSAPVGQYLRGNGTRFVSSALLATDITGTIDNSQLTNSSVTVNAGTGMSGGGTVSLGGSITLDNAGVTSLAGTLNQVNVSAATGNVTLSAPQDIHTGANPTFNDLTLSSNNVAGGVVYTTGTGNLNTSAAGTTGQLLISGGAGAPTWSSVGTVMADLTPGAALSGSAYDGSSAQTFAVNALNGLTVDAGEDAIELGGALDENTIISGLTNTNKLNFIGTGVDAFNVDAGTMSVDFTNNRVGVGTAAPSASLHISNALSEQIRVETSGAEADIHYVNNVGQWEVGTNNSGNGTSNNQFFVYDNAYRLTVQRGTGNVGVGTTTPIQLLDVNGRMNVTNGVIQRGTTAVTVTNDLGLYSQPAGHWIRIAANAAPIKFFIDQGGGNSAGSNALMALDDDNGGGVMIASETGGTGNAGIPNARAAVEISSTTKGMLTPRMTTTQRDAMGNSLPEGLLIYNTSNECFEFWDTKSTPNGGNGFWNSLCQWCQNIVIISSNQTGYNLATALGGGRSENYCVYINSGITLQAAGNGGGSGVAGNPGFNASTMPSGARITLYNYGTILAGGGNGGQGGRESDGICEGDQNGVNGGTGGHAILTSSSVPVNVFNYGTIRAGGGGGGGGRGGCCSAGGGGGGGAGTPAGSGGPNNRGRCVRNTICGCTDVGTSSAGTAGTATTGGAGGNGGTSGGTGCPGSGSGSGSPGGAGGANGAAGGAGSTVNGCCGSGCTAGSAGTAGFALQGNGSGSSLSNLGGTVVGSVSP